jgi:hypothetical protein
LQDAQVVDLSIYCRPGPFLRRQASKVFVHILLHTIQV